MAKYDRLGAHLRTLEIERVNLDFNEIGDMVGGLPNSAFEHRAWWANTRSHPNAVAWLDAGWEVVEVDFRHQRVTMRRIGKASSKTARPALTSRNSDRPRLKGEPTERVAALIADFPDLLDYYDRELPFDRSGQYASHRRTIDLRLAASSVDAALQSDPFLESLYSTLEAWGIGTRASKLVPVADFASELRRWSPAFEDLDGLLIDALGLGFDAVRVQLWDLVEHVEIVTNQARIVALSKAIHHLLPDLLPPIDRMYTQEFFGIHSPQFQYQQERAFRQIWEQFVAIARAVDPAQYVGPGWRTSRSKVIDNAVVAFVHRGRENERES